MKPHNPAEYRADDHENLGEKVISLGQPAGPAWDAIEAECPSATLQEKAILWTIFDWYTENDDWPYYDEVTLKATSGYVVKCPCCNYISQYIPPFENRMQVHDAICELINKGFVRCEIDSAEGRSDERIEEPDYQPLIILVVQNTKLIDTILSNERGGESE